MGSFAVNNSFGPLIPVEGNRELKQMNLVGVQSMLAQVYRSLCARLAVVP